jgi:hypothetical protein
MIAGLTDEGRAIEALLATGDLSLIARVQSAAAAEGVPVEEVIEDLVGWFNASAAADDWVHVMAVANRSSTPGEACLSAMLTVALRQTEVHHDPGTASA